MKKLVIILILAVNVCNAQTTLYFFRTVAITSYNPTANAGWTVTTGNSWATMMPNKTYGVSVVNAAITSAVTGAAAARKLIIATYISQPLIAQTINSGSTISGQWRTNMSSTSSRTGQGWIYVRLLNEDGTVASEIANGTSGANLSTSTANKTYSITLGSNVTVTNNQRLCIEIGWNYLTGSDVNTTASIQMQVGVTSSDLPVDNTTTTALNPFVTFSQTLSFAKGMAL